MAGPTKCRLRASHDACYGALMGDASDNNRAARAQARMGLIGALLGALVGGGTTYLVTQQQIRATTDSAAQQRHSAAVGTARLMREEFNAWADLMENRIGSGRYAKAEIRIRTELEPSTRLQVASAVEARVWEKIAAASSLAPKAQRLANRQPNKVPLSEEDRMRAPAYRDAFKAASAALEPLAIEAPT